MKACIVPGCADEQHQYGFCEKHLASTVVSTFPSSIVAGCKRIGAADVYESDVPKTLMITAKCSENDSVD